MSHTYRYRKHITSLQSTINPITRYPLLYKTLIFSNIISTSVSRHTDNTRALYPSHNTACFVTARLAVQLNGIVQNHSTCHYVATTQLHFLKSSTITLVWRNGIFKNCCPQSIPFDLYIGILGVIDMLQSCAQPQDYFRCHQLRLFCTTVSCKVVKRCLLFIWCFFKKNCFVTPSFNNVGFAHIDYVRNAIGISMIYQSDKHIVVVRAPHHGKALTILLRQNPKESNLKQEYACAFFSMRCGFERKRQDFLKLFHV